MPSETTPPSVDSDIEEERKLIRLLQILYVAFYASQGCLQPFLPIYYDSLGHKGAVIGLIGSINPLTTFIVAPLWGILSDRSQRPFAVLYTTILLSLAGNLMLSLRSDQAYILFVVTLSAIFSAPIKPLIDSMSMGHLPDRSKYGKLRVFGILGYGGATSLAGWFISEENEERSQILPFLKSILPRSVVVVFNNHLRSLFEQQGMSGFHKIFLIHTLLHIPILLCLLFLQQIKRQKEKTVEETGTNQPTTFTTDQSKPPPHVLDVLRQVSHNNEAMLVFSLVSIIGISAAAGDNFVYIRMREVGATGSDMGFSRLLSSIFGAPVFYLSGYIKERLGVGKVFFMSFLLYAARFFLYSAMKGARYGYFGEGLRGPIYAAFWSSSTFYLSSISPTGSRATMVSD